MTDLTCPRCNHTLAAEALLGAASGYSRVTDSGASSCSSCGEHIELRLRAGVIELGYTYWAGSMHFDAVSSQRVEGLSVAWADDVLTATVGGRSFIFSASPGS
jgi:transcription elongation factor Elf1